MRSAIIDIGYNAIRAVVYEEDRLGAPEIFSNKFKNDILTLLANESLDIKHQTYLTIQYLLHVFDNLQVSNIKCVATAVLRNHPRAEDFIKHIESHYNFDIEIISGEEEARLTALGLISGIPHCDGLAADLGGGSLELVEVNENKVGKLESLELGTKVISSRNIASEEEITKIIKEKYEDHTYKNLYLIGGALRFIGRIYIDFTQYPLKNLHNLEIPTEEFSEYLDKLQSSSSSDKSKLGKRRINQNAIYVAKAMIEVFKPENIIVSTFGLKEGVRVQSMSEDERQKNIVLEKVKYTCNFKMEKTNFEDYIKIVEPLVANSQGIEEIIKLSIILMELRHKFDKTLHPKAIAEFIISSEIPFTHRIRVMLALIQSYATNYKPGIELIRISKRLISKEDHNDSQIIGHFLRIAEEVDGPNFTTPTFTINKQNHFLEIDSREILPRAIFEKVCARLKSIAFARKMNSN